MEGGDGAEKVSTFLVEMGVGREGGEVEDERKGDEDGEDCGECVVEG